METVNENNAIDALGALILRNRTSTSESQSLQSETEAEVAPVVEDAVQQPATVVRPYINREKSWLKFNERVLEEAEDTMNPLMERLKFIGIFASNLDEFFMVRVGSLFDALSLEGEFIDRKTGMNANEQLDLVFAEVCRLSERLNNAYANILKALEQYHYYHVSLDTAEPWLLKQVETYFQLEILPLLSPQIINPRHPFPFFNNEELYVGIELSAEEAGLGIVPVPPRMPRKLVFHSDDKEQHYFVLLEDIIAHYMPQIFSDAEAESFVFRVTRNGDMDLEEGVYDEDIDWRQLMEQLLKRRNKQAAVRLQLSKPIQQKNWQYLCHKLQLTEREMIVEKMPLDLSFCFGKFEGLEVYTELYYEPRYAVVPSGIDRSQPMIEQIADRGDLLLAYPYHSMRPFIDLLEQAAVDPNVMSIKITLYRVASESRIVNALMRAAENGKDVLVLVELRARFDEQHNIDCSKQLEEAGCTVIYGVEHYKVHTKLMVITYRKQNKTQYITQIGTGNYNEKTATLYTDLSLITPNAEIGREATEVFQHLALGQFVQQSNHLLVAPQQMKRPLIALIDREIAFARQGEPAKVVVKTNSLSSKDMIDKLIEASQAGVEVVLLVRGICCLQAGIPNVSDNIRIHSIVGRYLEHSRIFSFGVGKRQKIYIGSADWMTRNLDYRVEVAVEVLDDAVKKTLHQMLELYLQDNRKLRTMGVDGHYYKTTPEEDAAMIDSQVVLFDYFAAKAQKYQKKIQKEQKKQTQKKQDKKKQGRKRLKKQGDKPKEKSKKKENPKLMQYGFLK